MIDVYQAATQMTDESEPDAIRFTSTRCSIARSVPRATTARSSTNMHTDSAVHAGLGSDRGVGASRASVPIISAQQLLTWLDGRNGSSFGNISWNGTALSFTVAVGAGANGLQAMLPFNCVDGTLTTLTRGGSPVTFTLETIKGVSYALFTAAAGAMSAQLRRRHHAAGHLGDSGDSWLHDRDHDLDDERAEHVARRLRPLRRDAQPRRRRIRRSRRRTRSNCPG